MNPLSPTQVSKNIQNYSKEIAKDDLKIQNIFEISIENTSTSESQKKLPLVKLDANKISIDKLINPNLANAETEAGEKTGTTEDLAIHIFPDFLDDQTLFNLARTNKDWEKILTPQFKKILQEWKEGCLLHKAYKYSNEASVFDQMSLIFADIVQEEKNAFRKNYIFIKASPVPFRSLPQWVEDRNFILFYNRLDIQKPEIDEGKGLYENAKHLRMWMEKNQGVLQQITHLDLNQLDLKMLPKEVGYLTNLRYLNCIRNQIYKLPDEILKLKNLRKINFCENKFTHVPSQLFQLKQLVTLNFQRNEIVEISPQIGQLKNLDDLNFESNLITYLPKEIKGLSRLKKLDLSCNELDSSISNVFALVEIKRLELDACGIKSIGKELGNLKKLENLNLSHNLHLEISEDEVYKLPLLEELTIYRCPKIRNIKTQAAVHRDL